MRRIVLVGSIALIALGACSHSKPVAAPPPPPSASPINVRMDTFEMNGYTLSGAEYWPYVGKDDIKYPEEVLWGFYPEKGVIPPGETEANVDTANPAAVFCAQESFAALQVFLAKNPP